MIEKLLAYHQTLVSPEFVERVMQRIEKRFKQRSMILGLFTLLGIVTGSIGFLLLWPDNFLGYLNGLDQSSLLLLSVLLVGFGAFMVWLMNDEFESP